MKDETGLPLLSVITVVRNGESHLAATIDSIIAQCYPALDYIIVDGGSTDGTPRIIERYRQAVSTLICEPDSGIYDAMNKGIGRARGELIAFLNAGDRYLPGTLEAVADAARRFPQAGILYGDTLVEQEDAGVAFRAAGGMNHRRGMGFHHPAMFARARVYRSVGGYDLSYSLASDYDFVLRALDAGVEFRRIERILAAYLNSGESYRNRRGTLREIRAISRRHFGVVSAAHLECLRSSAWSLGLMALEQVVEVLLGEAVLRRLRQAYIARVLDKGDGG